MSICNGLDCPKWIPPMGSLGSQVSVVVVCVVGAVVVVSIGVVVVVVCVVDVVVCVVDIVVVAFAVTILRTESISLETSVKEAAIWACLQRISIINIIIIIFTLVSIGYRYQDFFGEELNMSAYNLLCVKVMVKLNSYKCNNLYLVIKYTHVYVDLKHT